MPQYFLLIWVNKKHPDCSSILNARTWNCYKSLHLTLWRMGPWPFLRVPGNGRTQSRTNDFCAPTASKASLRLDTNMNYHLCLRVTVWGGRQKIHSGDKSGQKGRWRNKTCQCCWKRPCSQKVPWCLFHSKKYECCLSDTGITREKYQFWLKCYINNLKKYFILLYCSFVLNKSDIIGCGQQLMVSILNWYQLESLK